MYREKISFGGNVVIVEDYHTYRCDSIERTRAPKQKKTTEQQKAVNARRSAQKLVMDVLENFKKGDYWIRLSYRHGERPKDIYAAHEKLKALFKKVKRKHSELYYVGVTEEGSLGGLHHHILIPAWFDINEILKWWNGGIYVSKTYTGELSQLASYLTKGELDDSLPEGERDMQHHKGVRAKLVTKSRNLKKPKTEVKTVRANHWREEVKTRRIDGYTYDIKPGTLYVGFNEDGYPYRRYIMIRREGSDEKRRM